ncbi:MAG: hypothetical protein E4H13_13365, partial [Calditrichales bacterium]
MMNSANKNNKPTIIISAVLSGIFLSIFLSACANSPATFIMPYQLFTDHMVLQANAQIKIWGKATPNGEVTVRFRDQHISTFAGTDSVWQVQLDSLSYGGPDPLYLIGKDTLTLIDVLVGEVWICSGQSNMDMPLGGWGRVLEFEQEIAEANDPHIRLFKVERTMAARPLSDLSSAGWQVCSPQSVGPFSAVAYFFARSLQKEINYPVGLIQTAWGGSPVESWMSREAIVQSAQFQQELLQVDTSNKSADEKIEKEYKANLDKVIEEMYATDPCAKGGFAA